MAEAYLPSRRSAQQELARRLTEIPWLFVALIVVIGLVGYAVLYSAAGGSHEPWAWRHGVRLLVGVPLMLALALVDLRVWHRLAYPIYGVVLALLVAVDAMGIISKGAQRWLDLGPLQIQPSELMKIALVLVLARWFNGLDEDQIGNPLYLVWPLLLILVPVGLVLAQPDLGTAIMLVGSGTLMLFMAGVRWWKFIAVGAAGAAAFPILWGHLHDYQRQRVFTFLDPESDPLGAGYHIIQSKIALGAGGFWGQGYLAGSQAQLSFLPEKQTDFAFSMMAEEMGFVGAAAVLALFFATLMMGLFIAARSASQFGRLVAAGVTINLMLYVTINVAMVTGLIPVVGIPLPFISYGGTAMLTTLMSLGLLLGVAVHRDAEMPTFADGV